MPQEYKVISVFQIIDSAYRTVKENGQPKTLGSASEAQSYALALQNAFDEGVESVNKVTNVIRK